MPPRAIRVAYVVDSFQVGGTELNAIRTLEGLVGRNFDFEVIHLRDEGPLKARYVALGVPMHHVPISGLASVKTARQAFALAGILRSRRVDVVHTHDVYTNVFGAPTSKLLGGASVIASRRWWFEVPRPGLNALNRWCYRFADKVLANSPSIAQMLTEDERVPPHKVFVVPNFIDEIDVRTPTEDERRAKLASWCVPPGAFVIGMVGRLTRAKNYALAIEAIAKLPSEVHLVIAGDGDLRKEIAGLVGRLGLRDRVHLLGEAERASELQGFYDISLLTSKTEGFPNVLLEAMQARRAVIATAVGGVPDVVTDGETGLLIREGDGEALVVAVMALRDDPVLRERLGCEARLAVVQRFGRNSALGALGDAYTELARRGSRWLQ
jgi:glycosyltransferase involved in cell wall biosynthesis